MPIEGIEQPAVLPVSRHLRLRRYDGVHDFALVWYLDPEMVRLVDGVSRPYDRAKLDRMYHCLNGRGELYFIEQLENDSWRPVGDVTLCREDLPIVIGDGSCRGRGVGRAVLEALIARARSLGWDRLCVQEIYHYNTASRRLFTGAGFAVSGETGDGNSYILRL